MERVTVPVPVLVTEVPPPMLPVPLTVKVLVELLNVTAPGVTSEFRVTVREPPPPVPVSLKVTASPWPNLKSPSCQALVVRTSQVLEAEFQVLPAVAYERVIFLFTVSSARVAVR